MNLYDTSSFQNWNSQNNLNNTYAIWDDWKKKISPYYQRAETGLLGREQRTMHPSEGVISSRHGGAFGHSGLYDQSLEYAGGKIDQGVEATKNYALGKPSRQMHPEGMVVTGDRSGFKGSQMDKDIHKGLDQGIKFFDKSVNKAVDTGNEYLEYLFPNAEWAKTKSNISTDEKKKIGEMIVSGKVDHGFLKHINKKASPPDENELKGIEKFIGVSKETAMKNWKDKGGFEGLMSNPAFTLGLALMQSSAEGKSIGSGILDNFVTAAGISEHYKDRINARTKVLGPPTKEERDLAAGALQSIGISGPGWGTKGWDFVKLWGKDNTAAYNAGLNKIIIKSKEIIKKKYKGKTHQITEQDYIDAFKQLQASDELGSVENIFGVGIEDMKSGKTKKKSWIQKKIDGWFGEGNIFTRAEGGPVNAGQPYVVGEKGPEIVVPNQNATVLSNDDSQVMSMLLASNPQLQNISRARAEGILRSRFPDYFA